MNKRKYIQPEITIVDFRIERGYESVLGFGNPSHSSLYDARERFFNGEDFATGESFGGYTGPTGEYAQGIW